MLTFKLSHFHLDDVLLIAILVQKHTFKKNLPKNSKIEIQKFSRKNASQQKINFKIAITQKLRFVDTQKLGDS